MQTKVENATRPHFFYGWWIVVVGFILVIFGIGAYDYLRDQIFELARPLGGSVTQMAMITSISSLAGMIVTLAIGPIIDRFGPRKAMLIGIPMTGIGFLGLSFTPNSYAVLILEGVVVGIGMSAGFLLPVQTATANWFIKRRSIALTFICIASVLGSELIDLLDSQTMDAVNQRNTFLGLGLAMLAIGIPLAFVIKHRPEQYGYLPDGQLQSIRETGNLETEKLNHQSEINYTLWQAMKTRTFWMLTIGTALAIGFGAILRANAVPFLLEKELHFQVTLDILKLAPIMGLVGIMLFGYLGDLFSKRYLLAIAVALQSASAIILMTTGNTAQLYLYVLVYSLGSGIIPLLLAIRADYFGRKAFATITAVTMFISDIAGTTVSLGLLNLSHWLYDITESQQIYLLISLFIGFIPAAVFFFAKTPRMKRQVAASTENSDS